MKIYKKVGFLVNFGTNGDGQHKDGHVSDRFERGKRALRRSLTGNSDCVHRASSSSATPCESIFQTPFTELTPCPNPAITTGVINDVSILFHKLSSESGFRASVFGATIARDRRPMIA